VSTYSSTVAAEVGSYFATLTGIPASVATAWALDESGNGIAPGSPGSNNNPYNVEVATYATWQQGVAAAAQLIKTSSYYAGIRAAITTGNPVTIAKAIIGSDWCKGCYNGTTGGVNLQAIAQGVSAEQPRAGGPPPVGGATGAAGSGAGAVSGAASAPAPNSLQATGPGAYVWQALTGWMAQVPQLLVSVLPLVLVLFLAYKSLQLLTET
jgi:hypothetical protein